MKKLSFNVLSTVIMVAGFAMLAAGCSGDPQSSESSVLVPDGITGMLPAFPADYQSTRQASDIAESMLNGSDFNDRSPGAVVVGTKVEVTSIEDELEFAIYRHEIGFETALHELSVDFTASGGAGAWVCIADYSIGRWQVFGPYSFPQVIPVNTGGFLSTNFNNFFVAVIGFDGTFVDLASTTLTYESGVAPPSTYMDTMQPIFDANCMPCHSSGSATAGIVLDTYWQAFDDADAALAKILADHAPTGSGSMTTGEKDSFQAWVDGGKDFGEAVTYTNFVNNLTSMSCSPCHTGGGSSGGVNWDTYASAFPKGEVAWGRIKSNSMPQGGPPLSDANKDKWLAWVEQGKPE